MRSAMAFTFGVWTDVWISSLAARGMSHDRRKHPGRQNRVAGLAGWGDQLAPEPFGSRVGGGVEVQDSAAGRA